MNRNGPLWQVSDAVMALTPVNLAAAASSGRWVNMANVDGLNVIILKGIGASGEVPVITLEQARDSSGTGAKTLPIRAMAIKVAASTTIAAATDIFTQVVADRDSPINSYTATGHGDKEAVYALYIIQQDLDVNNGFSYIRCSIADVGATAQLGAMVYIPSNRVYKGGPSKFSLLT